MPRSTSIKKCNRKISKRKHRKLKAQQTRQVKQVVHRTNSSTKCKSKLALREKYGDICWICNKYFGDKITFHHIVWKSQGGDDSYENGSLLCEQCQRNLHKHNWGSKEIIAINKKLYAKKERG